MKDQKWKTKALSLSEVFAAHDKGFDMEAADALRGLARLEPDDLAPDLAGIRAKLQGPGEPFRDFVIAEESARGLPGWVNLVGIESPGLTCCLAIGRVVADRLEGTT